MCLLHLVKSQPMPYKLQSFGPALLSACLLLCSANSLSQSDEVNTLPELGEGGSSLFSSEQEYQLGRAWLRMFRASVATETDPALQDYLEQMVFDLATHSQLQDRRLELVVVRNRVLNAFAVPGGVVGVHTGLILNAETEEEIAAVLAHELGHLSQRHFSRSVEDAQSRTLPTLAGMLTGLVLAAAGSGDAGMAAIMATQAGARQAALRYSRQNEQEADRAGILTMVNAGLNPRAVPTMFERMQRLSRYQGNRIPEFLLTHPVTESRIADSRSRAERYPAVKPVNQLRFAMMKAKVEVSLAESPIVLARRYKAALESHEGDENGNRYGLALAQAASGQLDEARKGLNALLAKYPGNITLVHTLARLELDAGNFGVARQLLERQLKLNPRNYVLSMPYAEALRKQGNAVKAEKILTEQVRLRPFDPYIWYELAETRGLANNVIGVHEARAEYFILNGQLDRAEMQLGHALNLVQDNFNTSARIRSRLDEIAQMKKTKL